MTTTQPIKPNPLTTKPAMTMVTGPYLLRPIEPRDNAAVKTLVVETLAEFGHTGNRFACADPELDDMTTTYAHNDARFWVIEDTTTGAIMGCGGYDRLRGTTPDEGVVEMQKLYFNPALRGKGLGKTLCQFILDHARFDGYQLMYIETTPKLTSAVGLYKKLGFDFIDGPLGATGHSGCTIYMTRPLTSV
jgi:putative acetyltransferase